MLYTSITNPKIKELKKLKLRKYREQQGLFLVEGEHLVLEAYQTGCLKELILEQGESFSLPVPTSFVTTSIVHELSEVETPQSILGLCQIQSNQEYGARLLLLDALQDPGNLGTIIRSAVAFHIDTIILGKGTVDLYNAKTVRSSQGMLFHMNFVVADLTELIPTLQKQGYDIYGTKVTNGKNVKELAKREKFAIIVGNEGNGIQPSVEELLDQFLYIEMNPVCESLNVGVAASILLYELDK